MINKRILKIYKSNKENPISPLSDYAIVGALSWIILMIVNHILYPMPEVLIHHVISTFVISITLSTFLLIVDMIKSVIN